MGKCNVVNTRTGKAIHKELRSWSEKKKKKKVVELDSQLNVSWDSDVTVRKTFWKPLFPEVKLPLHWNYCVQFCCS